ncbi:hypothetical protein ACFO5X_00270 [Seohaeicola nanhaiensis]|uniref:Uncharacterized protein n=1 Tax=Seohaeicola nanhaiensis TaxID=1387282 RepID=A0ABV9K9U2_9RHOB
MLQDINLPAILTAAFIASSSPDPATLTTAGTAINRTCLRLRRAFEAAFALSFGALGLRILTARLT